MSFQGDVAGVGLAELLQGLARSEPQGVLTLEAERQQVVLGIKDSLLYLLASPEEDINVWRERAEQAWAQQFDPIREFQRRNQIARAARMEGLYAMLEAPNLHFRFEPGPLPTPPTAAGAGGPVPLDQLAGERESPWGQGLPVEFMLLEHARLSDESQSGAGGRISRFDIARVVDLAGPTNDEASFLAQCDGSSTLGEIADRMGWPFRQVQAVLRQHIENAAVYIAQPHELLFATQAELNVGQVRRAASRLTGWTRRSSPVITSAGEFDLLLYLWQYETFDQVLRSMEPRDARAMTRRLDRAQGHPHSSWERWEVLRRAHEDDQIITLHALALAQSLTMRGSHSPVTELMRVARGFQKRGHHARAATTLRLVTNSPPEKTSSKIELGTRLMEVGLVEEGVGFLVDAARDLIKAGEGEKAKKALHTILQVDPDHRAAHGLLLELRTRAARRKRRKYNSVIGLSVVLALCSAALVRMRWQRSVDAKIAQVTDLFGQPREALSLLEQYFGNSDAGRVSAVRSTLLGRIREQERALRQMWMENHHRIEQECRQGDPLAALREALAMGTPPIPSETSDWATWPTRSDLLNVLAGRFDNRVQELDLPIDASDEELLEEVRFAMLIGEMLEQIRTIDENEVDVEAFRILLQEMETEITERQERRAEQRRLRAQHEVEAEQDKLLAEARSHAEAHDLARALDSYERLIRLGDSPELEELLEDEKGAVERHLRAVQRAEELATQGEHEEARKALEGICKDLSKHLLPWRVVSSPAGARARFGNGVIRKTPFVAYSGFGEAIEMSIDYPGHIAEHRSLVQPGDLEVFLEPVPERQWLPGHAVAALPVPVGDDHIAADRGGRIVRMGAKGELRWAFSIDTLGGIKRTPVFMPSRPGHLLVLSEDGQAWIVRASDGKVEGPWEMDSPPVEGPRISRGGVSATFANGKLAIWTMEVFPQTLAVSKATPSHANEDGYANIVALRPGLGVDERLTSPDREWRVEIDQNVYRVFALPDARRSFTVRRKGEWTFVAWEPPNALIPDGRLWISDEAGLRSYLPAVH